MQASAKTVEQILETRGQFIIPFFQRHYSWDQKQWRRLWNDLMRLVDDGARPESRSSVHFLGPLVTIPQPVAPGSLPTWQVIDGQQRLTTITLLLAALRDVFRDRNDEQNAAEVMDTCLVNTHKKGIERYKVVTRVGDREVLERIVEGTPGESPDGNRLAEGVKFFADRIRGHISRHPNSLLSLKVAVTARLSLVTITLEGENPYEIFESLNATGLPLEESDLIRNYLFMRVPLEEQQAFQERRWKKLEGLFPGRKEATGVPTDFYRAYLMRDGSYSKQKQTYLDFRSHCEEGAISPEDAVEELVRFATFASWMDDPARVTSRSLKDRLFQFAMLDMSTARPLVFQLLHRHDRGTLTESSLIGCLDDLISFLLRRSICGESTRPYAKWLVEAIGAIVESDVRGSLQRYYARRGWPGDEAFVGALSSIPIFVREHEKARLVLEGLEAALNPAELIEDAGISIEHVLPRILGDGNSAEAWRASLGAQWEAEHARLVHVIGNLSLTGKNSDMSNSAFEVKRPFLQSSRFLLNREIGKAADWTVAAIESRSRDLAERAAQIWLRPASVPTGRAAEATRLSRTQTKKLKADYWSAILPEIARLPFVPDVPRGRTFGLVTIPLTRRAFQYGLRPRFQKKRLSLLLFMRGSDREHNFDSLLAQRGEIEEIVGERLTWKKSVPWSGATSVIELTGEGFDPDDVSTVGAQADWFATKLARFHAAFHDRCVALAPNDEPRRLTPTRLARQRWWTLVLESLTNKTDLFAGRRPPAEPWIGAGSGVRGLQFTLGASKGQSSAELYIDRGSQTRDENKRIFDLLFDSRVSIEKAFGGTLDWNRLDTKRASRVRWIQKCGYSLPEERWPEATSAQADAMVRLVKALRPSIDRVAEVIE
jgi:hypothetical protein